MSDWIRGEKVPSLCDPDGNDCRNRTFYNDTPGTFCQAVRTERRRAFLGKSAGEKLIPGVYQVYFLCMRLRMFVCLFVSSGEIRREVWFL